MREALAGLTVRGRAFLAAGATALVCGIVLDQQTLKQIGVLMIALPLLTAFLVGRGRYRLALVRHIEPQLTEAGRPARVDLTVSNEGWIPTGTLLLEETVPYTLGARPRFVVGRVGHGWRRQVGYRLRSDVRGRFAIGPMTVTVADPFGLVELGRAFQTTAAFTVTPRTVSLTPIALGGEATSAGDARPRSFLGGSAEDVTVRDYRRGDELRRVHWRSSAHVGELMVRREEQPWQPRATVFLDNRLVAHRGQGMTSSFEQAVVAAASVAVHLVRRSFAVRLVTASGEVTGAVTSPGIDRGEQVDAATLLEALALVQLAKHPVVDVSWADEPGQGGVVVAVLGAVDE
ncbi:MAG: DUF58 domain-containing protein, partial [Nocardioides sp.]|nr:DUF58 domain-containing protein [Nocardioides sp.]